MDTLFEHIRDFINNGNAKTPEDIIKEIASTIEEVYPGEAKQIYAEMVDKVFSVLCIREPSGLVHYFFKTI